MACCVTQVLLYGTREQKGCFHYCRADDEEGSLKMQECFKDYKSRLPDHIFVGLKCDERSGATMLGRTSGWGGLVLLGLVVSTAATML